MFASSGNEIKIWNLEESYAVVNEFSLQPSTSRRPKLPNQKTTINGLSIKPDSELIYFFKQYVFLVLKRASVF